MAAFLKMIKEINGYFLSVNFRDDRMKIVLMFVVKCN